MVNTTYLQRAQDGFITEEAKVEMNGDRIEEEEMEKESQSVSQVIQEEFVEVKKEEEKVIEVEEVEEESKQKAAAADGTDEATEATNADNATEATTDEPTMEVATNSDGGPAEESKD